MTIPAFGSEGWTAAVINHLWQSTVVAAIAWTLALALRKNHARVRYWVWMVASVKFLLPFWLLMMTGEWLRSLLAAPIVAKPALANAMEQIAQPFPQTQFFDARSEAVTVHHANLLPVILLAAWACGALIVILRFGRGWLGVHAAMRAARPLALAADVPVFCSTALIEPGIFGIFRPVLLSPEGILDRLTSEQLRAIIAHEMCHVQRRDNLTFVIHMVVEALFWFHPAVWWIGARLVEERERACDEAVLAAGSQAEVYAEGILNVCKFYVESPLACVSGVSGSDLKKRIAHIMSSHGAFRLTWSKKVFLAAAVLTTVVAPVVLGLAQGHAVPAESKQWKFAVVSIRRDIAGGPQYRGAATADGYQMKNMFLGYLFRMAYVPQTGGAPFYSVDQFIGMPAWLIGDDDHYDLDAKVDEADLADWQNPAKQPVMLRSMLQAMLEDRLKLVVHRTAKEAPVYLLEIAKNGPKFKEANPGELHPGTRLMPGGGTLSREEKDDQMTVHYFGISMAQFVAFVLGDAGRPVQDKTGLAGKYDITLQRPVPGAAQPSAAASDPGPSAAEIANQLGLKLEPSQGQVETLVIDHVERPSPN